MKDICSGGCVYVYVRYFFYLMACIRALDVLFVCFRFFLSLSNFLLLLLVIRNSSEFMIAQTEPLEKNKNQLADRYIYRNTHIRIRIYCNFLQSIYSFRIYYLVRHFVPFKMDFAFSFNFMIGYFSFRKTFHFNVVDFYLFLSFYLCMCV